MTPCSLALGAAHVAAFAWETGGVTRSDPLPQRSWSEPSGARAARASEAARRKLPSSLREPGPYLQGREDLLRKERLPEPRPVGERSRALPEGEMEMEAGRGSSGVGVRA